MKRKLRHWISEAVTRLFRLLPVKNRVFFYTIRRNVVPLENMKCVYDAVHGTKVLFAQMLPHSFMQMLRARYFLLTSRVIVTDDYIRYLRQVRLRPQQKVIQLWHAAGAFKRFGLDAPSRLSPDEERATHDQYTDVIVSGEAVREIYAGAFGVSPSVIRPLGLPRTDALRDPARKNQTAARVFEEHPDWKGKTIYLYAPTFRELDGTVTDFDPKLDFAALDAALSENELLLVKRHPVMQTPLVTAQTERIFGIDELSAEDLLAVSSVLITDYSSLIFDAFLCGVPSVFYCPDLDRYERSFYAGFASLIEANCIKDAAMLLPLVRRTAETGMPADLSQLIASQLSACDGHAAARVTALIQSYLS